MKGVIASFRGSHNTQRGNQVIAHVEGVETRQNAVALEGKKAVWTNPEGKDKIQISGYVSKAHGGHGAVRIVLEKGLPGQGLGTPIEIQ